MLRPRFTVVLPPELANALDQSDEPASALDLDAFENWPADKPWPDE